MLEEGIIKPIGTSPWVSNLVITKKVVGPIWTYAKCIHLLFWTNTLFLQWSSQPSPMSWQSFQNWIYGRAAFPSTQRTETWCYWWHTTESSSIYMPLGLSSALRFFQNLMTTVLAGLQQTVVYLDDIVIHTRDQATDDVLLHSLFKAPLSHHVTLITDASLENPLWTVSVSFFRKRLWNVWPEVPQTGVLAVYQLIHWSSDPRLLAFSAVRWGPHVRRSQRKKWTKSLCPYFQVMQQIPAPVGVGMDPGLLLAPMWAVANEPVSSELWEYVVLNHRPVRVWTLRDCYILSFLGWRKGLNNSMEIVITLLLSCSWCLALFLSFFRGMWGGGGVVFI